MAGLLSSQKIGAYLDKDLQLKAGWSERLTFRGEFYDFN
jgi:hypothetical protein